MSDKSVIVITSVSKNAGMLDMLRAQLAAADIPFVVNASDRWFASVEDTLAYYRAEVRKHSEYERIVFCDGFDMLFFGTRHELRGKLPQIVVAAERNCFPDAALATQFPETGTPWRYVNVGFVAGSPGGILRWCEKVESQPGFQEYGRRMLNQQYFNLLRMSSADLIPLDSAARVVYCMNGDTGDLGFTERRGKRRPHNKRSETWPNFIHFNGSWPAADFMAAWKNEKPNFAKAGAVDVPQSVFAQKKLLIATPMYGGNCTGPFAMQCLNLQHRLVAAGVSHSFRHIYAESLIPRARNNFSAECLAEEGWTELLFLDADIVFTPDDVLHMLAMGKDVIGAPYAKKSFDWEKIKRAVIENPNMPAEHLPMVGCAPVLKWIQNGQISLAEAQQVESLGTGMLLIRRQVFERLVAAYPEIEYQPMPTESQRRTFDFFGVGKNPDAPHNYLSEDYWFESKWRAIGGEVWVCPWMVTRHIGLQEFPCDLPISAHYNKCV